MLQASVSTAAWPASAAARSRTSVDLPTPCTPLRPTKKGASSGSCRRWASSRARRKAMQCDVASFATVRGCAACAGVVGGPVMAGHRIAGFTRVYTVLSYIYIYLIYYTHVYTPKVA